MIDSLCARGWDSGPRRSWSGYCNFQGKIYFPNIFPTKTHCMHRKVSRIDRYDDFILLPEHRLLAQIAVGASGKLLCCGFWIDNDSTVTLHTVHTLYKAQ